MDVKVDSGFVVPGIGLLTGKVADFYIDSGDQMVQAVAGAFAPTNMNRVHSALVDSADEANIVDIVVSSSMEAVSANSGGHHLYAAVVDAQDDTTLENALTFSHSITDAGGGENDIALASGNHRKLLFNQHNIIKVDFSIQRVGLAWFIPNGATAPAASLTFGAQMFIGKQL